MKPKSYNTLVRVLSTHVEQFNKICSSVLDEPIMLHLKEPDRLRLFNLKVWADQLSVPLEFVISELVLFWTKKIPFQRRKGNLGIRITTLVSSKSKSYLISRIKELYPAREHLAQFRQAKQEELYSRLTGDLFMCQDPRKFYDEYKEHIESHKKSIAAIQMRVKKPFRNNPFQ